MKNIIFLIILISSYHINAQTYFGFKVGANATNFYGDIENNNIKLSFHAGVVAEIQLSDAFSVQPELLFSAQGYQNKEDKYLKYHYNYLNLPIMVKYFINNNITLDFGPQIGYLLSAETSDGLYIFENIKENSNSFDYGINLGASYEFDDGLNINVRYNYSLSNINKGNDIKVNNAVIQISLGYKFY